MIAEANTVGDQGGLSVDGPTVLSAENLRVYYWTREGPLKAVNDVSFYLKTNERFGLVGESGSGKSTVARAIMGALDPPGRVESGRLLLNGVNLLELAESDMRQIRLAQIAMIPQGTMNSLNPVVRIKSQIEDGPRDHGTRLSASRIAELLESVGLTPDVADLYPHELSGGMRQRVAVAISIALRPAVIIADEPTSALDVVVQRHLVETLIKLQEDMGAATILIGHDMGLMAQFAQRVGVMYGGRLVEVGPVGDLYRKPLHPYTRLLISSLPDISVKRPLRGIPGLTPSLLNPPSGCIFHPRCPEAIEICSMAVPPLQGVESGRQVACHLYDDAGQ